MENAAQTIKIGNYRTIDAIMQEIGRVAFGEDYAKTLYWIVDNETRMLHVFIKDKTFIGLNSQDLRDILGFNNKSQMWIGPTSKDNTILSDFPVDLHAGCHTMYAYCDLLGNEILGDKNTKLLRVVPLSSMATDNFPTSYFPVSNLQFKVVEKRYFNDIEIKLCDETGKIIPFLGIGRTNVTLLFKKSV